MLKIFGKNKINARHIKLISISIIVLVFAFVFILRFRPLMNSSVNIELSKQTSQTVKLHDCFWQDNGRKYKCHIKNISDQSIARKSLIATAYDNHNNKIGELFFPKYHKILPDDFSRESIAKVDSAFNIHRIYIQLNNAL